MGTPKAPHAHQGVPDVRESPQYGDPSTWGPQILPLPTKGIQMSRVTQYGDPGARGPLMLPMPTKGTQMSMGHPSMGTQVPGDPKSSPCPPVEPKCQGVTPIWGPKCLGTPNAPCAPQGDPGEQDHPNMGTQLPGDPKSFPCPPRGPRCARDHPKMGQDPSHEGADPLTSRSRPRRW